MQTIQLPETARSGVSVLVRSRACSHDGSLLEKGQKINLDRVSSFLCLDLRSEDEFSVHRVAALALLQGGGRAFFSMTRFDALGRYRQTPLYLGTVILPPSTEICL